MKFSPLPEEVIVASDGNGGLSKSVAAARSRDDQYQLESVYNVGGGPHFGSGLTIDTSGEQYKNRT